MNPLILHALGKQASDTFIRSGLAASLDEAIAKLASEHGLSPVQIQRVVEITNHDVNDRIRQDATDRTYTFKLASVDGVLGSLNPVAQPTVDIVRTLKAIEGLGKPVDFVDKLPDKIASSKAKLTDEPAELKRLTKIAMHKLSSRLALISRQLESERLGKLARLDSELGNLFHATKAYVLADKIPLSDLRKYACELYPDRTSLWNLLFSEIQSKLTKLGHPYTGLLAEDKALSEDYKGRKPAQLAGPAVTVINGMHGLAIQLAPIHVTVPEAEVALGRKREIDNFFSSVRVVEDSLDTNEQVEKEILKLAEEAYALSLDQDRLFSELEKLAGAKLRALGTMMLGSAGVGYGTVTTKALVNDVLKPWVPAARQGQQRGPQYLRGVS